MVRYCFDEDVDLSDTHNINHVNFCEVMLPKKDLDVLFVYSLFR